MSGLDYDVHIETNYWTCLGYWNGVHLIHIV